MSKAFLPDYTHNQDDEHQLARVLKQVVDDLGETEAAFASGFFDLGAWALLGESLTGLQRFRLLLGKEPDITSALIDRVSLRRLYREREGDQTGEVPDPDALMRVDLEDAPLDPDHWRLADLLMEFLQRDSVDVRLLRQPFLHAKAYLFSHHSIVGSSNFTRAGLTTNAELDLVNLQGAIAQQLLTWYDEFWGKAEPYKQKLLDALEQSKYGKPYDPYQVFIKALYERFGETLEAPEGRGAVVDLAQFQEEGLKHALLLLERHRGVLIADAVGLGKTFIGMRIMEHYLISQRRKGHVPKGLVICPAQLRDTMWEGELQKYGIAAQIVSQEEMGRADFNWRQYQNVDLVVVDESHNFRTPGANRYVNLLKLVSTGRRDKRVVLMTATPINNSLWDLYHQLLLLTRGSDTYYRDYRIPNLNGFVRMVDKGERDIFDLLEYTTVRRSRVDVRRRQEAGERIVIGDQEVRFPERELENVSYELTAAYPGVYDEIVRDIERLHFVPYNLAKYSREASEETERLQDRGEALIGIQRTLFLKRLESSVAAFRTTVRRQQAFQRRFCELLDEGKLLGAADHRKLVALERRLAAAAEEDEGQSVTDPMAALDRVPPDQYDMKAIQGECAADIKRLDNIVEWVELAIDGRDAKCERLKALLLEDRLRGQKALVFTYYRDTADHIFAELTRDEEWLAQAGNPSIERITGDTPTAERSDRIHRFAPVSNTSPDDGHERARLVAQKLDILICTDVLSEGQNLQDAGIVINYDPHWNPVRMIQRAGRIDRLKSLHDTVWIHNFFPEDELENLLKLVRRVQERLAKMDAAGFLDASTLGEAVSERSLETIRRIQARDKGVLEELEGLQELASAEDMRLPLLLFIQQMGEAQAREIPLGIHSGMRAHNRGLVPGAQSGPERQLGFGGDQTGVFVAFRARDRHYWRFCREDGEIEREPRRIFNRIACTPPTPKELPLDARVNRDAFRERMLAQIDAATKDVLQEIREGRGAQKLPPRLTGFNKRLFDALNEERARKVLGEDLVQMLNVVLREIDLRPFEKDAALREITGMVKSEADMRDIAEKLREYFVETDFYRSVGTRPTAEEIRAADLRLVAYEVIW